MLDASKGVEQTEFIIVAANDVAALVEVVPAVRIVAVDGESSWPAMRAMGLRAARAKWAAVVSEDYRVGAGWPQAAMCDDESVDVLVGEVIPAESGVFALAAYLCEYLHVAAPANAGRLGRHDSTWVPAGAVVYRCEALDLAGIETAPSELVYHQRMFDAGRRFRRNASLRLTYEPPSPAVFFADRVTWSRDLAQRRAAAMGLFKRSVMALTRIGLPLVLLGRFLSRLIVRPRYWLTGLLALPFAVVFSIAQLLGELQGYVGKRP